ncbi:heavy-metal-associated domain-containing protein [Desulfolithobacter sp.]
MPTITIKGMKCQHCAASAAKALESLDGVSQVRIDLEKGEAIWEGEVALDEVREAIARAGYEVVAQD